MLTTFDLEDYVYAALRAGASGFLLKDAPAEQLVTAIEVVARGDALLAPQVTRLLIEEVARRPTPEPVPGLDRLTERELEVLRLMARGMSNAEIAGRAVPRRGDDQDPRGSGPHQARTPAIGCRRSSPPTSPGSSPRARPSADHRSVSAHPSAGRSIFPGS